VFDLAADPDETTDVAEQRAGVIAQAAERLSAVTGPLPVAFRQYRQRAAGRTMRSFAPVRFGGRRT
jgi:hypothetical protein